MNMPEYALTVTNVAWVLNMLEFWIWQSSECHNMTEYYVYSDRQGSEYVSYST